MSGTLQPDVAQQFFDNSGVPLAGGKVYFYASGTSTPQATYSDVGLTVANTNPVILDSAGRAVIFWSASSYKVVINTSADVLVRSIDGVPSTGISATTVGQVSYPFVGDGNSPITATNYPSGTTWTTCHAGTSGNVLTSDGNSPITATNYPSGTTWTTCHAGTSWWSLDSANISGTYKLVGMLLGVSAVTVTAAIVNLSDGTPDTPLASISSTSTTGDLQTSSAITFAASGTAKSYAIKVKVSGGTGYAWGLSVLRTA